MHRWLSTTGGILAAVVLVAVLTALGTAIAAGPATGPTAQTDSQGGVTIKVTYVSAAYLRASPRDPLAGRVDAERNIVFAITLDTHSGDLSAYDFLTNATLRNDRGQQVTPARWVSTADGSHHRAGALLFPRVDQAGRAIDAGAKALELVVRGLGGVPERVLRWPLPLE